jgi:tetratricopeptide (TPR) repeat protein
MREMKKGIVFYEPRGATGAYVSLFRSLTEAGFVLILKEAEGEGDRATLQAAHAAGIPCLDWRAFGPRSLRERAAEEGARRAEGLRPHSPYAKEEGAPFFRSLRRFLDRQILDIDILKRILHAYDVRLLVVGEDREGATNGVLGFAREAHVPTLASSSGAAALGFGVEAFSIRRADYVAVGSLLERDRLVAAGLSASQVFVTGWLGRVESNSGNEEGAAREARLALGLAPDRPVVLLRIPPFDGTVPDFIARFRFAPALLDAALAATRAVPGGIQLIVEPDAREASSLAAAGGQVEVADRAYRAWLDGQGHRDVVLARPNGAPHAARAADMIVCLEQSHALVEAMMSRRPTIAVSLLPEWPLAHGGLAGPLVVRRLDDLAPAIEALIADPGRARAVVQRQNQHLVDVQHSADGLAAERLGRLVLALCRQGPRIDAQEWDEPVAEIIAARAAMRAAESERLLDGVRAARRLRGSDPGEAEAQIRDLARAFPRYAQPVWEWYDQLVQAGRVEEAERLLAAFVATFTEGYAPLTVLVRLGLLRLRAGDREGALDAFEQARLQAPYEPAVLTSLGKLYMDTGRYAEAVTLFQDATDILPDEPDIWLGLAHAARHVDDRDTFIRATERYHQQTGRRTSPQASSRLD